MSFGSKSLNAPTKGQRGRFAEIKEVGCVACRMGGHGFTPAEIHHQLSGNRRIGHDHTVGLCAWHHRGVTSWATSRAYAIQAFGPSLAHGTKPFRAEFGSDDEMLRYQNHLLEKHRRAAA